MKIDSLPGLSDAVSGQVSSNKRIQSWEQEFLSQQRRSYSDNEAPQEGGLDNRNTAAEKRPWQGITENYASSRAAPSNESRLSGPDPHAAEGMVSERKFMAGYNRLTGQVPVAEKMGRQINETFRTSIKRPVTKPDLEAQLGKFKGHLVVEEDGFVSVWVGRVMSDSDKSGIVGSIKTMLLRSGLTLEKLTINGIEEQL
ncbi:hypothetical protein [Microbulbifer sp. SAOS-129_SWC]|uniref:hypothetical protein n=1 Tax=Microbulbifer sp. SAOS-129_SWC TaxID=3145235 RepID=UPI003216923E